MGNGEFLSERSALYLLLSRLFTYPITEGTLRAAAGLNVQDDDTDFGVAVEGAIALMLRPMKDQADLAGLVDILNLEATRLFEGPGQPLAPPYGSYYLNGKRLVGPEAIAVRKTHLKALLLPEFDNHLPADHLALELGFIAALAEKGSVLCLNQMRTFINEHILSWVPMWKNDVFAVKPHPFFAGLVKLTIMMLEEDLAWINEYYPVSAPVVTGALEESI